MKISEVLTAAKARLTPETWGQRGHLYASGKECAGIALNRAGGTKQENHCAYTLFGEVTCGSGRGVPAWNDADERTLQDVHDAFDAAIAIAQQQEAITDQPADQLVAVRA